MKLTAVAIHPQACPPERIALLVVKLNMKAYARQLKILINLHETPV